MQTVIVPLNPNNCQLTSSLGTFELLAKRYPDNSHDPDVIDYMMDIYYPHYLQQGNYRLCFDVALQAAQLYRTLWETDEILPRLARTLDKAASCAEILGEYETARPLLQETIGVYRKVVYVDPKGKQGHIHDLKILLARALVRYFRVVHRLGHDLAAHWENGAVDSLREGINIYTAERSFGQSGPPKYGEELKDALLDLLEISKSRRAQNEVVEVEAKLNQLRSEQMSPGAPQSAHIGSKVGTRLDQTNQQVDRDVSDPQLVQEVVGAETRLDQPNLQEDLQPAHEVAKECARPEPPNRQADFDVSRPVQEVAETETSLDQASVQVERNVPQPTQEVAKADSRPDQSNQQVTCDVPQPVHEMAKAGARLDQTNLEMDCDILQSVISDLAHLLIPTSQLTVDFNGKLGAGGYGEVFAAHLIASSPTPISVAVKRLQMGQNMGAPRHITKRLAREIKVWAKAKHPNILELIGTSFSESGEYAYLISAHMTRDNVKAYLEATRPNPAIRLKFVRGITLGIHYLHTLSVPICHGDLKPFNVLVNDDIDAVLCDFGLASFAMKSGITSGFTTSKRTKGTARYMSPELLLTEEAEHTLKSDIWGWACTAFEIITDCAPYPNAKIELRIIVLLIKNERPGSVDLLEKVVPNTDDICSPSLSCLKSVIPDCWSFDAEQRPSSSDLLNRLGLLDEAKASGGTPVADDSFSSKSMPEA
ncbi:hypothetical protein FRC01_002358 [Tulasnella sp. 417]|nr:hypothetical protein FRC01_002358 [Tulasnella sp. 417]